MSWAKIFTIYISIDLLIVIGVVWCVFQRIPASKYLIPAAALFVLNGIWLMLVTIRNTPPRTRN
jgi:hypothetical protein